MGRESRASSDGKAVLAQRTSLRQPKRFCSASDLRVCSVTGRALLTENTMIDSLQTTVPDILVRLLAAGLIGGLIGFERRAHHKAIGIAGMVLIAIGSTTFMLLAKQLSQSDPASISRTLQGLLSGIGFLGGAVIFKSGHDVRGGQGRSGGLDYRSDRSGDLNLVLVVGNHGGSSHLFRHVRG